MQALPDRWVVAIAASVVMLLWSQLFANVINELVNFYNRRFQMNLTEEQKRQLVAFLNAL